MRLSPLGYQQPRGLRTPANALVLLVAAKAQNAPLGLQNSTKNRLFDGIASLFRCFSQ